jgi:glycosyltransferase involved in cell wall biosynthesis
MEISFCVPISNRADYLKRCLNSILVNNDDDIEVIVQNNCAPDQTKAVVDLFDDKRLKYFC